MKLSRRQVLILVAVFLICVVIGFLFSVLTEEVCPKLTVYEDGSFVLSGCLPWGICTKGINVCQMEADEWELLDVGEFLECRPKQD